MTRRRFSGPVRSTKGFEVGHGDNSILVIDEEGKVHTQQVGEFEGSFKGDLEGNVQGNLNGNVTGDVQGNLTGNVQGNVTGDVQGDVQGSLTGSVSGVVGSEEDPAEFYGYGEGAFVGGMFPYDSIDNHDQLPDVPQGLVGIYYSADEGLVLKLADGSVHKIDVTPLGGVE